MTAATQSATFPFPARLRTELQLDVGLLTIVLVLLLGGFVILASASISVSDNMAGNPFHYLQRQLFAAAIGLVAGSACLEDDGDPVQCATARSSADSDHGRRRTKPATRYVW